MGYTGGGYRCHFAKWHDSDSSALFALAAGQPFTSWAFVDALSSIPNGMYHRAEKSEYLPARGCSERFRGNGKAAKRIQKGRAGRRLWDLWDGLRLCAPYSVSVETAGNRSTRAATVGAWADSKSNNIQLSRDSNSPSSSTRARTCSAQWLSSIPDFPDNSSARAGRVGLHLLYGRLVASCNHKKELGAGLHGNHQAAIKDPARWPGLIGNRAGALLCWGAITLKYDQVAGGAIEQATDFSQRVEVDTVR